MTLYQEFKNFMVNYGIASLLMLVMFVGFSVIHENRHKATAEAWGCDAEIDYLPSMENDYFMATHIDCPVGEMSNQEIMLHRMEQRQIESVGYHTAFMIAPLSFIIFVLFVRKESNGKKKRRTYR